MLMDDEFLPNLAYLDLWHCDGVTEEGARDILDAIEVNQYRIRNLNLSEHELRLRSSGTRQLGPHLHCLDSTRSSVTIGGMTGKCGHLELQRQALIARNHDPVAINGHRRDKLGAKMLLATWSHGRASLRHASGEITSSNPWFISFCSLPRPGLAEVYQQLFAPRLLKS